MQAGIQIVVQLTALLSGDHHKTDGLILPSALQKQEEKLQTALMCM